MIEAHPPADSPSRTWRAFLRAQLRFRNVAMVLLALVVWLMTRPTFEMTVAEMERLGGTVVETEYQPGWMLSVPARLQPYFDRLRFEPYVSVQFPDHVGDRSGPLLRRVRRFQRLSAINLADSQVQDKDLAFLRSSELCALYVNSKLIRGEALHHLTGMKDLSQVVITSEGFDATVNTGVRQLPTGLDSLGLNGPGITDETVANMHHLTNLSGLTLENSAVNGVGFSAWRGVPKINFLSLARSRFGDANAHELRKFRNLSQLSLTSTSISDAGVRQLANLPNLTRVYLNLTQVTGAGFDQPGQFLNLRFLDLSGAPVTDAGLAAMQPLPTLTYLNLSGTNVTDDGLPALSRHPGLLRIDFHRGQLTEVGIARMRSERPGVEMRFTE